MKASRRSAGGSTVETIQATANKASAWLPFVGAVAAVAAASRTPELPRAVVGAVGAAIVALVAVSMRPAHRQRLDARGHLVASLFAATCVLVGVPLAGAGGEIAVYAAGALALLGPFAAVTIAEVLVGRKSR